MKRRTEATTMLITPWSQFACKEWKFPNMNVTKIIYVYCTITIVLYILDN